MSKKEYYITYGTEYRAYSEQVYSTVQANKVNLAYQLCGLSVKATLLAVLVRLSYQQFTLYDALQMYHKYITLQILYKSIWALLLLRLSVLSIISKWKLGRVLSTPINIPTRNETVPIPGP